MNYLRKMVSVLEDLESRYTLAWSADTKHSLRQNDLYSKDQQNVVHLVNDSEYTNNQISLYSSIQGEQNQKFITFNLTVPTYIDTRLSPPGSLHFGRVQQTESGFIIDHKSCLLLQKADIIIIHFLNWFYPLVISAAQIKASIWWEAWGERLYAIYTG